VDSQLIPLNLPKLARLRWDKGDYTKIMKKKFPCEALNPLHGTVNYLKELTSLSKTNRNNPTEAENKIWKELLRKDQTGYRFLRQKPINRFILDFYCSKLDLAIEIDGNSHNHKKGYDNARDKFLQQIGIKTIRFTNDEILNDLESVKQKLQFSLVKGRSPDLSRSEASGREEGLDLNERVG